LALSLRSTGSSLALEGWGLRQVSQAMLTERARLLGSSPNKGIDHCQRSWVRNPCCAQEDGGHDELVPGVVGLAQSLHIGLSADGP
jgi:hypothetical protein